MSDFFIPKQNNDDYWTKKQKETQTTLPQQNTQNDYWGQRSQALQQQKEEQLANYNRYGVDVPDEYYEQFNKIISQVEDPAQAQEEAYRIGSAIKYSQMYGMPIEEAYTKVDELNEAQFPDLQDQKGRFEAICDMFTLGNNNVKLGLLGQKLMTATGNNDTEMVQSLMAQIDALQQENVLLQDKTPRKWVMQALEAGAQSLPFTGYVAGAGVFGNFIAPGVGTGAAFATSSYLAAGQEYLDMRANGASHETAAIVSTVSGLIQGLIEADLGITNGIVKGTAKAMGKEAAERAAKKSLEDIGTKIAKRFHFGPGKKLLVNYLKEYGKNVLGEGTEEFLQEITSIIGQEVAASLDGYDIPDDDFNHIVKQTTEAFKGGVLGAISMGFIPAGINGAADIKSFKQIKDIAEEYESGEMFKEAVKENPVFEGMSDEQKADVLQEVWEKAQQRKEARATEDAKQIAEGLDAGEGAEERKVTVDENGNEIEEEAESVARDEKGRLYTNDEEIKDDNGNVTGGTFLIGNPTKKENNRYGYIRYSTNENGDITIDDFKINTNRTGLREEVFDEFAREHPDVKIEWNPKASEMQEFKQSLIDANPSGAKNGLNYYSSQDLDQVAARKKVAAEVRRNIHNVTKNADGSYTRTDLNNKQVAAAVTLIESAAKRMDMSLSDYVSKTFGNQIFGSREEFAQSALAQGEQINDKAGGMNQGVAQANWKQVGQQVKAVIYAGENADFSTWAHEMAHVFQNQLDGDLKTDAETAFNVVNGDWINSKYTFSDGRTMSSAEAFAYGFQDWLETGHAESQQMQNIFQKFAQFIADCYNKLRQHLNFTPEIESVFNRLLDGDDTIMSKALKAAQEEENEYRASLKRKAEEAEATKKAEAEEAQRQAELEKEEAEEYTDYEQEVTEQSAEEIEAQLDEGNEEETGNAIDDALENLNISDEQKAQTAEVLKDETSTIAEKADAIVDAAGEQFDLFQKQEGLLYQLAGEPSIKRMAESEEKRRILADLDAANELEKKYKSMPAESRAARIRMATGWEKDANGQWKYELDDSINRIKGGPALNNLMRTSPDIVEMASKKANLNLGDIYDAPELYKVFPYMKNVRVSFYSDPNAFRAVLTPEGIKVNMRYLQGIDGEKGLKGALVHEIQHVIQAMEYAESTGLQGADIEQLYNDMMDAMQAAGDKKYDYDTTSLQEGLDAYMNDYGEIEARNVARRILMNPDQRRNTTLASTEDVNRQQLLFQIAGEIGAQNLDDAETQEGVSRMQNLAIAKEMEAAGKDAQEIRLATGWEKGDDGLWRYELDDSKVTIDVYGGMKAWERFHPEYRELTEKLYRGEELTEKEQDRLEELSEVYYLKQEKQAEEKHFMLEDVLDFPELFKAYPTLQGVDVYIEPSNGDGTQGEYRPDEEAITLYRNPNMALTDWEKQAKSVLLHEVQHAIQQIEGFAKGGSPEQFTPISTEKLEERLKEINNEQINVMSKYIPTDDWIVIDKELREKNLSNEEYKEARINAISKYDNGEYRKLSQEADEIRERIEEIEENLLDGQVEIEGRTYMDENEAYRSLAGEVESRNVQARQSFTSEQRLNTLIAATEDVAPEDKIILFQTAYHGSGADFDKFDTENYGLSGEGSMSFGYGTYVTDSEEIARDYANRQGLNLNNVAVTDENRPYFDIAFAIYRGMSFEDAKEYVLENNEAKIKHHKEFIEKMKNSSRSEEEKKEKISFAENRLKEDEAEQTKLQEMFKTLTIDDVYKQLGIEPKRNLYTVEIPNDGFIKWDENMDPKIVEGIIKDHGYFYGLKNLLENYNKYKDDPNVTYLYGSNVYKAISKELRGSDKAASHFLYNLGFKGIDYPAGTIYGNGEGSRNYVIFNDDDAKIIDHLLFQTNAELMQEAQGFETWQDFMEFCEVMHSDDEVSPIPSEADAQWYQSFWETSHGLQTEQEKNEQAVQEQNAKETTTAKAMDALFTTYIRQNPEMLDDFLHEVARIDAIDLDSDEWRNVEDDMDAAQRDKIDQLKDAIAITMSDYNWQSAMRRVQGGGEISEGMRKRLMGEMTDTMKSRDFRALYAEVMEDPQYAVDEQDTTSAILSKKLQKYQKRYYDIVKPGEDISKMSPEKRKRIAEAMDNRDIANKIRNGSLKLDDELFNYIKSLDRQIKDLEKQYNELEIGTQADYQRIADAEKRRLLKLHEELLMAKSKVTQKNSDTARKINKGLKITEKYKRESQNLQANYDELFRKFNDLKNTIQITAEVQAALDRQEQVATVREDLNAKQKEKNLTAEVKKMRINLVKRTMRRVPFNRIDYDNAKTVIAIQRMLEPNLIGGVNKFIGIDSPFLRGVISQIVTDSEYRQELMDYLNTNSRASEAFMNFKKKLSELKSIKDFDSWTAKDRKAAIRYLPKENWVRDLNLKKLAKEREESIDLDIDTQEYSRQAYDENGKPKTYKDADGIEHNVMETAFRLRYSDELGQLVKDAVGADMFDRIVNRPFSEWTTEELEQLAQRIDELYTKGRDLLAAKNEARKREAEAIRKRVEDAIKETGIVINDDDTPEEKERKQKEINKILNLNSGLKGTEAGKEKGIKATLDRLIHGYSDMNVLRFARMLDNQSEDENVYMLYRREDECYNNKTRSINNRAKTINEIMKANKITEGDLAKSIPVPSLNTEFTVDELLYFLAADKDYVDDEKKLAKGLVGLEANDDWAATSRNAVMFGNMMSDSLSQEQKEKWVELDKEMELAIKNDTLTAEQKQLKELGQLDNRPGTSAYISYCHAAWAQALSAANSFIAEHPEYKALMEAIEADYAAQYERMNEVSINEFNMPVHRVRAYVPLVRRESNGDTNVNQVKEDLLGAYGADAGKQWVNKGMTQRRVQMNPLHQKPVQTGLFATWGSSVDRTEHFIAYAPYVRQLNAIYKSRDASYTRRFIESRYGKGAVQYLDNYINEVANPNAGKVREAGAEWLHTLRGRTAPAYLGWKFSAIIKQGLTSPWPYMQFVNPAEYASAALECTRKGTYEAIREKSVFMNNRVMDPMNELIEEMAEEGKTKFDRALGKFGKKGMAGLEWIDWVCVAPGWLACYKKEYARLQRASESRYDTKMEELRERNMYADIGTSEYMNAEQMEAQARKEIMEDIEVEAVRYADDCTRQCQPSSRAADLAPLFKNSSEAMKAFLQFQTSLNVIWQNIRYDMPYAVRNKQFKRIVYTILGYVFAGIFMNSVMEGVTSGADDDDDKGLQALRNLVFYSTTQFTDAIPIMGSEITNVVDQFITGKRGFMQSGTDMTPSATKLLSALTNASKGNWEKAATLSAEAIGMAAGAPVSGLKEINKLLGKPLEEGDINLLRGISDVYGIAGDIIEE